MSASTSTGSADTCMPSCGAGEYCKKDTKTCESCATSTEFKFGTPTKINLSPPSGGTNLQFPRIGKDNQLLFTYTDPSDKANIGYANVDGSLQWKDAKPEPFPISSSAEDAAALYLDATQAGVLMGQLESTNVDTKLDVILYDSNVAATTTKKIYAINLGKSMADPVKLYAVAGTSNNHIAVAPTPAPGRFWFTNTANLVSELVTSKPGEVPVPVAISIEDNTCPLKADVFPWVTPDGTFLFFAAQPPDAASLCTVKASDAYHLFYTKLDANGQQDMSVMKAKAIFPGDTKNLSTPSLSPDRCVLFFTDQTNSPNSELYAAVRE
jgi:hypothetical protein